jgi:hypothetical protein
VEGEELGINRPMGLCTRENPEAEYRISTHSHLDEDDTSNYLNFTDSFLFEHGLFNLFKEVAQKIESGESI